MSEYFFPGCRIKKGYPTASERLAQYMKERYGLEPMGCCKDDYTKLTAEDTALLICNNCICEMPTTQEPHRIQMITERIDKDSEFPFPDYQGRQVIFQDCHHGYGEIPAGDIARSLLGKMNLQVIDAGEERAIPDGLSYPEHAALVKKNAEELPDGEIVTNCAICNLTMKQAGRRTHLLLDLLFDVES